MNRVLPKIAASCQGHIPEWSLCRVPARIEFQHQNSAFHHRPHARFGRPHLFLMHARRVADRDRVALISHGWMVASVPSAAAAGSAAAGGVDGFAADLAAAGRCASMVLRMAPGRQPRMVGISL